MLLSGCHTDGTGSLLFVVVVVVGVDVEEEVDAAGSDLFAVVGGVVVVVLLVVLVFVGVELAVDEEGVGSFVCSFVVCSFVVGSLWDVFVDVFVLLLLLSVFVDCLSKIEANQIETEEEKESVG